MSAENNIEVTRPELFPECKTCPIVDKVVSDWQNMPFHNVYNKSERVESVKIECEVRSGLVLMSESGVMWIRKPNAKREHREERQSPFSQKVRCPHFDQMMKKAPMFDREPE